MTLPDDLQSASAVPAFYQPDHVAEIYEPDLAAAFKAGLAQYRTPASADKHRVLAWLIDMQVDFVFPAPVGRLPVPNALDDARRTIEWLYRNAQQVTHIAASLDTHLPFQIFHPSWWVNAAGKHPDPFTVITAEAVEQGHWRSVTEPAWSIRYLLELERVGKKQLMIWPFHCIEGTNGRALVPALSEAIMYHSAARMAQPTYLPKGKIAQTEFYSVVEPEVKYPQHPEGGINVDFLNLVGQFDLIYVAGEARSHCVLETMNSVLRYYADEPDVLQKFRFLDDCASSITGFEAPTEARIKEFVASGIRVVRSTDELA